jgi:thiol-disulfide isomerase/thioredoxin
MTAAPPPPATPLTRPPRWRGWLVNIALVVLVIAGVDWWKSRPLAQGEAPPLRGLDLHGQWLDLRDWRGEPVLVHFWGSWCPICRAMEGSVDAIATDHRVLTVALQSGEPAEIAAYLQGAGLNFPVIPDPDGAIASRWGVRGVPASFILSGDGQIVSTTVGLSTESGLRLRLWAAMPGGGRATPAATRVSARA